ncbi:MAG TPA: nucleotide pyrophosphohydrolase [Solirubrobacteraceae bacterium]|jgi:NTP pyrophosphatase (non-canonical NTP hydrolase)
MGVEPSGAPNEIERLTERLRSFAQARSWEHLHTPKNLTTAVAGEAGELAAVLQWSTPEQDLAPLREELEDEIADVLIYLLRLCDVLDVDPMAVVSAKIDRNELRFPTTDSDAPERT